MDNQITGLAGEYFVAAELLKRGWQVAMTIGNAKSLDLLVTNESGKNIRVQIKTLRKQPNCFDMHSNKVKFDDFYVFVYLNQIDKQPDYFILKGSEILVDKAGFYGASLNRLDKRETINHGSLKPHFNKWDKFNE